MNKKYTLYKAKRIITMDAMQPEVEAILVCDNRISEVGEFNDLLDGLSQRGVAYNINTDYEHQYVFPGFIESHCHASIAGIFFSLPYVGQFPRSDTLNKGMSFSDNESIVEYLKSLPNDHLDVIMGWGYDPVLTQASECLTRFDLDKVSDGKPVIVFNDSCHAAVLNTRAMEACGLMNDRNDKNIIKDEQGIPDGQLVETTAFKHAFSFINADINKFQQALKKASNVALKNGFTSMSDMAAGFIEGDYAAMTEVAGLPDFPVRLTCYVADDFAQTSLGGAEGVHEIQSAQGKEDKFKLGGVKFFTDGSIQVHTACMHYHDSEGTGVKNTTAEELEARYLAYAQQGIQCATHCNGTDGIQMSIDRVKAVSHQLGVQDRGFRMEHCQTVTDDQLEDLKKYGITPSFLINHLCYWSDFHAQHSLGLHGIKTMDPCHSAKRHDIRFSLHSDCPVSPLDPFVLIYGATERKNIISGKVYGESERISVLEAVKALTLDAAYIQNEDHIKGNLVAGKLADFVVLDRNLLEQTAEGILDTKVLATCCDGKLHTFNTL